MLQLNYIFTSILVFLTLSITKSSLAFYYTHELSTIPSKLLEPYKQKHHLSDSFQKIFNRGLKAYSEMDFLRAEQAYNTLLLINSRDIIALERLAQVYLKQGKISLATNALLKILRIEPEYHPAHNHLAQIYLYKKDFKQSIRHAKYLVENGLAYVETYLHLINALFFMKQYDNMISICRVALEAGANHPQFSFFPLLADLIAGRQKQFEKKYKIFNEQFENHPDLLLYTYLISLQKQDEKQLSRIDRDIRKASFSHPVYPLMFLTLGIEAMAYTTNKEYLWKRAIQMSNRVIKNSSSFLLPYRISLDILRKRRDFERILPLAQSGVEKFPKYNAFLEYLGEAAFFLNESDLALDSLQKALKIRNTNPDYLAYTAILMLEKKEIDPQEALSLIDLALSQDQKNPFAQTALGLFYYNAGEAQRASISLKQAIAKNVQYPLAWNLMIKILRNDQSNNSAYKIALKARSVVKNTEIYKHAIELAFQRAEYRNCIKFGKEGLSNTGDNHYFKYLVAQSYMKLDQYSNALTALEGVGVKSDNKEEYNLLYLNILMTLEYYPEAEAKIKQLLKVHTRNSRYQAFFANYNYHKRDFKEALKIYQNIVKITGSKEYFSHTGWLKFLLKNKKEAIKELTIATKKGNNQSKAIAHYRLGLIYALNKTKQRESSDNYTRGYELAPKLKIIEKDHNIFNEITKGKHDDLIQKVMRLYIQ